MQVKEAVCTPISGGMLQERLHSAAGEKLRCYAKRRGRKCLQTRECCEGQRGTQRFQKIAPPVSIRHSVSCKHQSGTDSSCRRVTVLIHTGQNLYLNDLD